MVPKDAQPHEKYQLTPDQSTALSRDAAAARQQITQLNQKAEQLFGAYRADWVRHYREAMTPIVQQVARERKASVVLVKNDTLMFAESSTDITDAVVEAARAKPPEVASVAMPHLEAPAEMDLPSAGASRPAATQP